MRWASKRYRLMVAVVIPILFLISAVLTSAEAPLVITAKRIATAPTGLNDPLWSTIPPIQVPVQGRATLKRAKGLVSTRAVYTGDTLFMRLRWKDPTRSVVKQSWQFDGHAWRHLPGNEDRIALLFEITRIDKFATRGCAVVCHSPADLPRSKWKLATRTPQEKGDLWHWKAARSAPYNYADDAWLTVAGNPTGSYRETGRRKDSGIGGDIKNETAGGTKPRYRHPRDRQPAVDGFLLFEEAVKIADHETFAPGHSIPYRLPLKPAASRFDVKARSRWQDGYWTVLLWRRLDTGHADDIAFNPLKRYSFAMAVFNDSGADHSKATQPLVLKFGS